jgi:hypothetical protein
MQVRSKMRLADNMACFIYPECQVVTEVNHAVSQRWWSLWAIHRQLGPLAEGDCYRNQRGQREGKSYNVWFIHF